MAYGKQPKTASIAHRGDQLSIGHISHPRQQNGMGNPQQLSNTGFHQSIRQEGVTGFYTGPSVDGMTANDKAVGKNEQSSQASVMQCLTGLGLSQMPDQRKYGPSAGSANLW